MIDKRVYGFIALIIGLILLLVVLPKFSNSMNSTSNSTEKFDFSSTPNSSHRAPTAYDGDAPEEEIYKPITNEQENAKVPVPLHLLPSEGQESAFEFAPKDLREMNFMDTQDRIGIDTVSNTLKNANYSIRPDPQIVKTAVSPWMNSEIDADPLRNTRALL
jgi:hypothetical protein